MGKNNKPAAKQAPKEKVTPKAPKQAPNTATVDNQPTTEAPKESVSISMATADKLTSRKRSGLSPDAQVQLLDLTRRTFVEERDPDLQFPKEVQIRTNKIVAIGILCTLADHAQNGDDSFATVLNTQAYPALSAAAADLGFKLPDIKALPSGKEPDTVMLDAKQVEVPEETKEQLKKEKEIKEGEKPELDPEKITSEEDLKKALEYIFVATHGKRLPDIIGEAIEFMKKFRLHEASLAENTDEAKKRFETYNSGDWLDDIFSYFRPPVFFTGIGRGMASCIAAEKSPIHAFVILRDAIKDKKTGEPVLEDQEIAYCVKSIVRWFCNVNIESNEKTIENLDEKKNKKEIDECNNRIAYYNNILSYITNPGADEVDSLLDNIGSHFTEDGKQLTSECQAANATFNHVCRTLYGKQLSTADYKNLEQNVQQYAGCIVNMFRDPASQLIAYKAANIGKLEERSEEEKEQLRKETKKAWAERKEVEKKEETKNA